MFLSKFRYVIKELVGVGVLLIYTPISSLKSKNIDNIDVKPNRPSAYVLVY